MNICIYTKRPYLSAPEEHILQNFLGARWTSSQIACDEAQDKFGKTIDVTLEKGLQSIRNLIGTKGGRGGEGPILKSINTNKGNRYHLAPGGKPLLAEPIVELSPENDGRQNANVQLGSIKQLGWAIAKIKQEFPDAVFDLEEIKSKLVPQDRCFNEQLHLKFGIGGVGYFRGLLKASFNLLGVMDRNLALSEIFDPVRNFIFIGEGDPKNHIRWLETQENLPIPTLSKFDHFLCVYSLGNNVFGIAQLFGDIPHLLKLSDNYNGNTFEYSYIVNPLRSTDPSEIRNVKFDKTLLPSFHDHSALPGKPVFSAYRERFNRILANYYEKTDHDNLDGIIDDILMPHKGETFSDDLGKQLADEIVKYFANRLIRK